MKVIKSSEQLIKEYLDSIPLDISLDTLEHFLMFGYPTIRISDDPKKGEIIFTDKDGNPVPEDFNPYNDFDTWKITGELLKVNNDKND